MLLAKLLAYCHALGFQIMTKAIAFLMSAADRLFTDLIEHESQFIEATVEVTWIEHRSALTTTRQPLPPNSVGQAPLSELPMG
ncbi:MAG: hypothetical protein F6K17_40780 [Okeania sp. SIO3C4]|nr:hypothetical protein [Okeania sp. SIO3C4]